MYSGVKALGGPHSAAGVAASLYFVLLVILGNCILQTIHSAEQSISRFSTGDSKFAYFMLFLTGDTVASG